MGSSLSVREKISKLAAERILVLDGAMGSLLSKMAPGVEGYNDLLCLSRPDIVSAIHEAYLEAGADIIETSSFNAASIMLEDRSLAGKTYGISRRSAELGRKAADKFTSPEKPRFVAGSLGPTAKSASIAQGMNELSKRAVTWDELEAAYYENARGLLDGGADLIVIETIFDTLNAKAAIFAVERLANERGIDVPLIISATLTENGRLLSGQTVEAFCVSVQHAHPFALGLNCSFGAEKLKAHVATVSAIAPCLVIAYPNAGFPNNQGVYEESPESMALQINEYLKEGLVNIVGGCCGSTPPHISAISEVVKNHAPRSLPLLPEKNLLSGLEVFEPCKKDMVNKPANKNAANSREFTELIKKSEYDDALEMLCENTEEGYTLVCLEADPSVKETDITGFINFALQYPDVARRPMMLESSSWAFIEAGLKCLQGRSLVNYTGPKGEDADSRRRSNLVISYGAVLR